MALTRDPAVDVTPSANGFLPPVRDRRAERRRGRELLVNLTQREIRGKYKRTALGQLWSLVNPLALMAMYTVVFALLLRVKPEVGSPSGIDVYALWLLCGLLPWNAMAASLSNGMGSLIANEALIKKVYFPRTPLVMSAVLAVAFTWAWEMGVLLVALAIVGGPTVFLWLPGVIIAMAVLIVFNTGVAMLLAIANVHFRDTQHFLSIFLQLWFYLTPVLYPVTLVTDHVRDLKGVPGELPLLGLYQANPMERFISVFRSLLYDQTWPNPSDVVWCVAWAAVVFALGAWVFSRNAPRLAEDL